MKRIIPLILVLIILAAGVGYLMSQEREDSGNLQELYRQTEPLQRKKDELQVEKEELAKNFTIETRDVSTVQILFRESHTNLFTYVYPLMRDRGITGVIGMSVEDYPGVGIQNRINVEQYNRLIMDGWGSCLIYDGRYTLENFLYYVKDALGYKKIELPTSIYFSEKKAPYDSETMDPILQKYGINVVIRNASDGRSETVSEVGEIWHTGAMPWNYTGVNNDLELLATTDGGNLTFTASFEDIWDGLMVKQTITDYRKPPEPEVQTAFIEFLDEVASMLEKESTLLNPTSAPVTVPGGDLLVEPAIKSTDYVAAREAHLIAQTSIENQIAEYEQMQADIDAQIAELEAQIADIYMAFNINYSSTKNRAGETA